MVLEDIVLEMYRHGLIKFGEFILTSGKKSPYYIDLRILPSYPRLYRMVMDKVVDIASRLSFDVVAGVATAGIVHAAYLGCLMGKPMAYVRKKPKEHGTRSLVEGVVEKRRVLLVDDVATTGGSLSRAVDVLRGAGAVVEDAVVIVDRLEGARLRLKEKGVELHSVLTVLDIINVLKSRRLLSDSLYSVVEEYLRRESVGGK